MDIDHITNSGANEQGVAAPAQTSAVEAGNEGARGQEIAEPAGTVEDHMTAGSSEGDPVGALGDIGPAGEKSKPVQSAEENAQFAAARRKAEREARLEAERIRAEEGRKQDALIAGLGFTHPETGLPVRTRAEYEAMQAATARQKNADLARRAGMSEEEWNRHVESAPAVVEARAMQARAAAAEQASRMERVRVQMQEELAEITRLDGTVKSFDDLRGSEGWPQMEDMMRRGYSMLDAYKLANYEMLGERRAAAARQTALNATAQKQHMQSTEQQGSGGITVPKSVMAQYRRLNPGVSDAEIAAHYAKYAKK